MAIVYLMRLVRPRDRTLRSRSLPGGATILLGASTAPASGTQKSIDDDAPS